MNRHIAGIALLLGLAAAPAPLTAQERGKIDEVERNARDDHDDDDDDDGGWWGIHIFSDVFKGIFLSPKGAGQGYLPYPYSEPGAEETFVLRDVTERRRFSTLSVARFEDASTSLAATSFEFEGANAGFRYTLALDLYREPKATETDHLTDFRMGLGGALPLGRAGYMPLGIGGRAVCLDSGYCAGGVDLEIGARLFPARPLGVSGVFRIGGMSWEGSGSDFLLTESKVAAAVFLGRLEIAAGWHWLKLGSATPFAGPTVTTRLWF